MKTQEILPQEILSLLIQNADLVYADTRYQSDPKLRARLSEAEEELLSSLFALNHGQDVSFQDAPIPEIVEQINRLEKGETLSASDEKLRSESMRNYLALRAMESCTSENQNHPVPKALLAYVERSLDFDESKKQKENIPGFAVTLLKEGLSVIKSSLQGFCIEPAVATSIRKGGSARSILRLNYQSTSGDIKIELLSEGDHRLGVRFRFPSPLSGQAVLKRVEGKDFQSSRILDSYTLNQEQEMAFHGLEQGTYIAQIPVLNCRLPFLVQ